MDPKKQKVLQAQLDVRQKRELQLSRDLREIPQEGRREFVLRELQKEPASRTMNLETRDFDDETQSFSFSFSSEYPVRRWFGVEVLKHTSDAVDLSRLKDGGAFCLTHDTWGGHIGVHEEARLDEVEKRCYGRARLSKNNERAVREYKDIKDGIRTKISTQYQIHDLMIIQHDDRDDEYIITSWTPVENSTVAVPADPSVGTDRELHFTEEPAEEPEKEQGRMKPEDNKGAAAATPDNTPDVEIVRAEGRAEGEAAGRQAGEDAAMERVNEMLAVGEKFGNPELARQYIAEGKSYHELVDACLEGRSSAAPPAEAEIGMSESEAAKFSFMRLMRAEADPANSAARAEAGFEYEAIAAARDQVEKCDNGLPIPMDVLRSQLISTGSTGGYLQQHTKHASMIEELVNAMKVLQLGAQPFGDLVGTFDMPKDLGGVVAHVIAEEEAPTKSTQLVGLLSMAAKALGASVYIPRGWAKQTSFDIEVFLRRKMMQAHALKQDALILADGIGGQHQPISLLNWPGLELVAGGTNGAAPTREHMVKLITKPDTANALIGKLAFLTSALVRGKLMSTPEHATANVGGWTWKEGDPADPTIGSLVGYPAHVSNQVPDNLTKGTADSVCSAIIFGNWDDLVIGTWGTIEVTVDPYTASNKGGTWIHTFSDFDSAVLNIKSFAAMKDALAQ